MRNAERDKNDAKRDTGSVTSLARARPLFQGDVTLSRVTQSVTEREGVRDITALRPTRHEAAPIKAEIAVVPWPTYDAAGKPWWTVRIASGRRCYSLAWSSRDSRENGRVYDERTVEWAKAIVAGNAPARSPTPSRARAFGAQL